MQEIETSSPRLPPPAEQAMERRSSPRVPIDQPVRLGPPGGLPEAAVSARDLSEGGLFIDADRPVRVGARFSVDIPFGQESIYVAEAEVAYNRQLPTGAGFGVRFVEVDLNARRNLKALIEQRLSTLLPSPDGPTLNDRAPFSRLPRADLGLDFGAAAFTSPSLMEDAMDLEAIVNIPKTRPAHKNDWKVRLRDLPWTQVVGFVVGALLLVVIVALAGAIWNELSTERDIELVRAEAPEGVDPVTHEALMGRRARPLQARAAAASDEELPQDLLPELESVDDAIQRADATRRRPRMVAKTAPAARPAPSAPPARAPVKARPTPRAQPKAAARPARRPTTPKATAKPAPRARSKPAARPAPRAQPKAAPATSRPRIRKSFVLKAPVRFAVDVIGLTEAELQLPLLGGMIRRVRTGRHDDFVRVVFDLSGPVKTAKARLQGKRLIINLDPA